MPVIRLCDVAGGSGHGFGVKIVGGKIVSDKSNEVGAFVTAIQRGGIADQLHGELQEGSAVDTLAFLPRDAHMRSVLLAVPRCLSLLHTLVLVHGQVTIIFVVSVCLSVCLFVQSFSQPSLIRFRSN